MTNKLKRYDVVVVGNVGIDTNVYFYGDPNFDVESNYTLNIDCVGQAGGYSARGFAQLGYRTAFIGYIGDDFTGHFIRQEFERDGIHQEGLFIDPTGTGRSVNFMYQDSRRKNFYDGKAHMVLQPDVHKCREILAQATFAHFSIPNWARLLLPIAKELHLPISCDLQDVLDVHDPYRRDFLQAADIVFFSAVNVINPELMMHEIFGEFPEKILICGMGAAGCALATKDRIDYFAAVELPDPVIDTNGAGDGLAVGFTSSYVLENYPIQDAILRGQLAARWTCTQKGTSSNLVTRKLLDYYFEQKRGMQ
ncbi:carbohydrate kinase family protein [candidate division KSB1 bacterium]|nr:carbohydrate kinase family protein [candidate division KSB1 bacterium]RQW00414.1 MAG: carbohydrate kinase family protein [candidate division KSB1 bacterium]